MDVFVCVCMCLCVDLFRIILTYYIDRDYMSPLSIRVSECMDQVRLTRTIVGFPDPLISLIASRSL